MTSQALRGIWGHPALRLPWGAAWRAQALHLAFFVVPPLLLSLGKMLMTLALPLLVIVGPGDRTMHVGKGTAHLHEPGCWIALAPCAYAEARVPGLPDLYDTHEDSAFAHPSQRFAEWPHALSWRHLWFAGWLAWFLCFLVDRERQRDDVSR